MRYEVYRTKNKVNGKFYYGVHKKMKRNDYLGSGVFIKQAIKKYGKENFVRDIIAVFDNREDAYALEALIVDDELLKNPKCYNCIKGGFGGHGPKVSYWRGKKKPWQSEWNIENKGMNVTINGIEYRSIWEAHRATGIDRRKIRVLCQE